MFAGLLVTGLLYVRLLHGPVSLDFLIHPIERAITEEISGLRVHIEGVVLRLGEGSQLEFELKNVRVADASDQPLALAPSATVSLSRKALVRGRIAPESVALISPRLSLFYGDDGTLSVKFATPAETPESERAKSTDAARSDRERGGCDCVGWRGHRQCARTHRSHQGAVRSHQLEPVGVSVQAPSCARSGCGRPQW